MSDPDIKVTDRRMFTPDGRLREGYEHLEDAKPPEPDATRPPEPATEPSQLDGDPGPRRQASSGSAPRVDPEPAADDRRARLEIPGTPPELGGPTFFDLVSVLAEPVLVYLGDARMPDGTSGENLEMARLYIDLLDLLRQKTAGRLSPDEATFLEDLLYQLRMRYVQKRD